MSPPAEMTPEERLAEVAALLARAVLRRHRQSQLAAALQPGDGEGAVVARLDLPPDSRLSVTAGERPQRLNRHEELT